MSVHINPEKTTEMLYVFQGGHFQLLGLLVANPKLNQIEISLVIRPQRRTSVKRKQNPTTTRLLQPGRIRDP
jgi:hypothetical protein